MNIIVTGGAGFIGSNFVFHMLNKYPDYRIVCLDKLTYAGNLSTLEPVMDNPNFRFVKADICDREAVYKLFEEEHTKGTKGTISEGLRQFLNYMENTDQNNAVNEDLKDIQKMVDVVKRDGEVSLQYMKSFEHDQLMYAQGEAAGREDGLRAGRLAEIKNTEREKKRADMAQSRIKELEAELKKYREKPTA